MKTPGYAALISVVMVMLTVTAIGLSLTITSADSLLVTRRFDEGLQTLYLADTCAHDALVQLRDQGLGYVGTHTLTITEDSCIIEVVNTAGTTVEVTIDAEHNDYHRLVEQTVDTSTMDILLWQEVGE